MAILNSCCLGGKIFGRIKFEHYKAAKASFLLSVIDSKGFGSFIEITAYDNLAIKVRDTFDAGDTVAVKCHIVAYRQETAGGHVYRKYYFILDTIEYLDDPNGYENSKEICEEVEEEDFPWGY